MSKLDLAYSSFKKGNYRRALSEFNQLKLKFKTIAFDKNIEYCEAKLKDTKQTIKKADEIFGKIYVVNMEKDVKKRYQMIERLSRLGLQFEIFTAINGYKGKPRDQYNKYMERGVGELTRFKEYERLELKRGKKFIESPGALGYISTYVEILKDAKRRNFESILILEDDILFTSDFEFKLNQLYSSVDENWKIIQLGASQYDWSSVDLVNATDVGYYYPKRLHTCGSFAIAINGDVFDELLELQSHLDAPFDHLPMGEIYENYRGHCYVAYPNIIMPDVSESSIRGKRNQYSHSERMKWDIRQFNYPAEPLTLNILISSGYNLQTYNGVLDRKNRPINVRFFYNSADGLRPLHNSNNLNENDIVPLEGNLAAPNSSFSAIVPEDLVLCESDYLNFVDSKLGIKGVTSSKLVDWHHSNVAIVPGRVSVVIPTYKRPDNLYRAVESVLSQDYFDLETIVVSDNDSDCEFLLATREVLDGLRARYPSRKLKFIEHTKNLNGAAARNTGILAASGEYICFLDDDDIYLQGRISQAVAGFSTDRYSRMANYCGFTGWNSKFDNINRYIEGDLSEELFTLNYTSHYLHTNTATYKRNAVLALNGFDESFRRHQDLEFNARYFSKYEISCVKKALVQLNPEMSNVSNKAFNSKFFEIKIKFLSQFADRINELGIEDSAYSKNLNEVKRYSKSTKE